MFTLLGWLLLGFAGISALLVLVGWNSMKDTILEVVDHNGNLLSKKFPCDGPVGHEKGKVDVELSFIGKVFIFGGSASLVAFIALLLTNTESVLCLKKLCKPRKEKVPCEDDAE